MRLEDQVCRMEQSRRLIIWGGVPADVTFISESKMFQQAMADFKKGKWKDIWEIENKKSKQ